MATTRFPLQLQSKQHGTAPNVTWGMFVVAALLALVIGLSAADVQRQRTTEAGLDRQHDNLQLDGRGKWAGYMQRSADQ